MTESYTVKDIQVLEGLDAVRKRQECISVPRATGACITCSGKSSTIPSTRPPTALPIPLISYCIPTGAFRWRITAAASRGHPSRAEGFGVEVVYTQLHAGGKSNNTSYACSGGLHGVGGQRRQRAFQMAQVEYTGMDRSISRNIVP